MLHNLGYILSISSSVFGQLRPALLADLEKALDASSVQAWSHHRLPTPTATLPAVIDSEEEDCGVGERVRGVDHHGGCDNRSSDELVLPRVVDEDILRQLRAVRKKLQQIEALEMKLAKGHFLDDQQYAKLRTKQDLENSLMLLESGVMPKSVPKSNDGGNKVQSPDGKKTQDSQHRRKAGRKKKAVIDASTEAQAPQLEEADPLGTTGSAVDLHHLPVPFNPSESRVRDL